MKIALVLGVLFFCGWVALSKSGPGADLRASLTQLAHKALSPPTGGPQGAPIEDIRKFDLRIESWLFGGQATAEGVFYDILATETTSPDELNATIGKRTPTGRIYVNGLPNTLNVGQRWTGWLTPAGAKVTTDAMGKPSRAAVFRVVVAPPPVAYREKPGAWMREGRTLLDVRPTQKTKTH